MKKNRTVLLLCLAAAFVLLMSVPFLSGGCGWMALLGFVPLLCMERVADAEGRKHFWWWHYGTFVAWNAVTTFWVCNATVGGGIFAVLANALQMSLVFGLFRWVKRRFRRGGRGGALPYLFLAAAWIAWEKYYLTVAEISWPWLVLGNAFAATPSLVQWYEFTGTLGGSLWVWASSLSVFGLMVAFSDGRFAASWNGKARFAALAGTVLALFGPMVCSLVIWNRYQEVSEGTLPVVIAQPDFDPYHKFQSMTQDEQNAVLLDQFARGLREMRKAHPDDSSAVLLLAPETFTSDILCNEVPSSRTFRRFVSFLRENPGAEILFGASSWTRYEQMARPSANARKMGDGAWYETHNSALIVDSTGRYSLYQKSKLVPGVEMLPYVKVLGPIDDKLLGGVAGRCVGQPAVSNLLFRQEALRFLRARGRQTPDHHHERRLVGGYARLSAAPELCPAAGHRDAAGHRPVRQYGHIGLHRPAGPDSPADGLVGAGRAAGDGEPLFPRDLLCPRRRHRRPSLRVPVRPPFRRRADPS